MPDDLALRPPTADDGQSMWQLAAATKVLDVNSAYAYVLWCRDFGRTSIVAVADHDEPTLAGFVTGYLRPDEPGTLFVWQVAVDEAHRGRGLASRLVLGIVERLGIAPMGPIEAIEATVAPSNETSLQLFRSSARALDAPCTYPAPGGFAAEQLPGGHEPEPLLRIAPLGS